MYSIHPTLRQKLQSKYKKYKDQAVKMLSPPQPYDPIDEAT
jgi:hypothetical protein